VTLKKLYSTFSRNKSYDATVIMHPGLEEIGDWRPQDVKSPRDSSWGDEWAASLGVTDKAVA
jgi:hypothetical protein